MTVMCMLELRWRTDSSVAVPILLLACDTISRLSIVQTWSQLTPTKAIFLSVVSVILKVESGVV